MVVSASRLAAESLRVLPRKRLSRMMGRLADIGGPSSLVARAVDAFVAVYDVDLSEVDVPAGGWDSFDAFFTRRLRDGTRPLSDDPHALVCPSDGRLLSAGPITADSTFTVKGRIYDVAELLGEELGPSGFEGGSYAIIYLAPPDYHRVHAPVTGAVEKLRHVAGTLYPVNAVGFEHVPQLFARNERVAVHQRTDRGPVATILVGAIGVGRISLAFHELRTNVGRHAGLVTWGDDAPVLARGDELGAFHLGSTVIVLSAAERTALVEDGARTRMGEALFGGGGG